MELRRLVVMGIFFAFAISIAFPGETVACYTSAGYDVDCCFHNPSKKNYCCATVADCCAEGEANCEYNTWRDQCECGPSCETPNNTCPTSSTSTTSTTSTMPVSSTTTTSCLPDSVCGDVCCPIGLICCGGSCCPSGLVCKGSTCKDPNDDDCCLTGTIYGIDSEEAQLLRKYRDEVLSTTPEGRKIIGLYYQWSPVMIELLKEDAFLRDYVIRLSYEWGPAIIKAIDEDEEFRVAVKEMIVELLLSADEVVE